MATLLSQLERDTGEPIIGPWVIDRHTIVGIASDRVVAAAHLWRYGTDDRVTDSYKDVGEFNWIIFEPDKAEVGEAVLRAAMDQLRRWDARVWYADGSLPCLGVYGVPDSWPHVQALLTNVVFLRRGPGRGDLRGPGRRGSTGPSSSGPRVPTRRRSARDLVRGVHRRKARRRLRGRGLLRNEQCPTRSLGDEGNHWVDADYRGQGIGSWSFRQGCAWLRLGGKDRLLTYAIERRGPAHDQSEVPAAECERYYSRFGLKVITKTRRGWRRNRAELSA